jgi:hypothetical protein
MRVPQRNACAGLTANNRSTVAITVRSVFGAIGTSASLKRDERVEDRLNLR